jgi:hypothetical protein
MAGEEKSIPEIPKDKTEPLAKPEGAVPKRTEEATGRSQAAEIVGEIEKMPPEMRQSFHAFLGMFSRVSGPRVNPLFEKFTDAHIDKYLDYVQRDDDHEYELRKTDRKYYLVYAILALVAFFGGVVYLLPRDKDLLIQLIIIIVAISGGIGAGYGLSKRPKK